MTGYVTMATLLPKLKSSIITHIHLLLLWRILFAKGIAW